ncbi:MAG: endopeptidase La [Myxococcales bacterium]|nr:endopeptidase La [Myxococcales bacterium]
MLASMERPDESGSEDAHVLPILPLRNSVLFPSSVVPVNVGRPRSVRLIEQACGGAGQPEIGVVAQRDADIEDPTFTDLHEVGTVARVLKVIRLGSGGYSVVLQGVCRMRITGPLGRQPALRAQVERYREPATSDEELDALGAHLRRLAGQLAAVLPDLPREAVRTLGSVRQPAALADVVASNLPVTNEVKQRMLETLDARTRIRAVIDLVRRQQEVHRVKQEISSMVQGEMSRSEREHMLRQQLRQIRRELGEQDEDEDDLEALRERVMLAELPEEVERAARRQLGRMRSMNPAGAEYQVTRTYVEWLADLPWSKTTPDRLDVAQARRVLDEDHYGLDKPKRRIVEHVAVRRLAPHNRAPILCFIGPPGVGKTSLAKSIARAAGRKLVRVSLGGVADEAEIRGHRRTYVGALPGRLITGLKKAGSRNPVIVLDEIDKLGADERGDPASALLEALDPEQNHAFVDHYIDLPFDLSQAMFIATGNRTDTIPPALLDRMEVIEVPGYTAHEKRSIARSFLAPRQLSEHGLTVDRLDLPDEAIALIIDEYTHEPGVRRLDQQLAALCRAVAVRLAKGEDVQVHADERFIAEVLGAPERSRPRRERIGRPGVAMGVAWTPAGGELFFVEATRMRGSGKIHLTGNVGDIMQESAAAAFTYTRAHASRFGLPDDFLEKLDVHLHLPRGSVPKDGPAAGITLYSALVSMLTRRRVRTDVATSGEMTLRGHVLRVEGIKEKCLGALQAGVRTVVLPARNAPDLDEVPEAVRAQLTIRLVSHVDEVLPLVFEPDPVRAEQPAV